MVDSMGGNGHPQSSAYERLRIPDEERYWVEQVKCRVGCPVFTDACGYVTAVAEGRDQDAYAIARATNPFVSVCGRICGAPVVGIEMWGGACCAEHGGRQIGAKEQLARVRAARSIVVAVWDRLAAIVGGAS